MRKIKNSLVKFDKDVNGLIGGNPYKTISVQDAYGVMERRNFEIEINKAVDIAHANMGIAGTGLLSSFMVIRKYPILGTILLVIGVYASSIVVKDWHNGKKYVNKYSF